MNKTNLALAAAAAALLVLGASHALAEGGLGDGWQADGASTDGSSGYESDGYQSERSSLNWQDRKANRAEAKKVDGSRWALKTPTSYWWAYDKTREEFHARVQRELDAARTGVWTGADLTNIAENTRKKINTSRRSVIAYAHAMHQDLNRTKWQFSLVKDKVYYAVGQPGNRRNDWTGDKNYNFN